MHGRMYVLIPARVMNALTSALVMNAIAQLSSISELRARLPSSAKTAGGLNLRLFCFKDFLIMATYTFIADREDRTDRDERRDERECLTV